MIGMMELKATMIKTGKTRNQALLFSHFSMVMLLLLSVNFHALPW
jgi:hypothetical protein